MNYTVDFDMNNGNVIAHNKVLNIKEAKIFFILILSFQVKSFLQFHVFISEMGRFSVVDDRAIGLFTRKIRIVFL